MQASTAEKLLSPSSDALPHLSAKQRRGPRPSSGGHQPPACGGGVTRAPGSDGNSALRPRPWREGTPLRRLQPKLTPEIAGFSIVYKRGLAASCPGKLSVTVTNVRRALHTSGCRWVDPAVRQLWPPTRCLKSTSPLPAFHRPTTAAAKATTVTSADARGVGMSSRRSTGARHPPHPSAAAA